MKLCPQDPAFAPIRCPIAYPSGKLDSTNLYNSDFETTFLRELHLKTTLLDEDST